MEINTDGVVPEIVITQSRYLAGVEVIEIPGLGYWASRESAQEALDKLARGVCPMSHEIDLDFEPRHCRICGQLEHAVGTSELAEPDV